jgi:hypothetical protein
MWNLQSWKENISAALAAELISVAENINKTGVSPKDKLTTFASHINTRSSFTKRTQTMSKINSLGFGVIYYWHWGWSYSPKKVSTDDYDEYKRMAKTGSTAKSGAKAGRFMYLGLAVQLPTSVRMAAHIKQAQSDNPVNTKAMALSRAIKSELTTAGTDGVIENPMAIPHIIHICSLFDLGPLEGWYVQHYNLEQEKGTDFLKLINQPYSSKVPGGNTIGVNTKASSGGSDKESAGQGSPIKQGHVRGKTEWIMATYWFLIETDPVVLASRTTNPFKFGDIESTANKQPNIIMKIKKALDLFSEDSNVSSKVKQKLKSITIQEIAVITQKFGLKDKVEGDNKKLVKLKSLEEKNLRKLENFNTDLTNFTIGDYLSKIGNKLEDLVSFETDVKISGGTLNKQQKFIMDGSEVSTELRTTLIAYLTGIGDTDFRDIDGSRLETTINSFFEKGLTAIQELIIIIQNRLTQTGLQREQVSSKIQKEMSKIEQMNAALPEKIKKKEKSISKKLENASAKAAEIAGYVTVDKTVSSIAGKTPNSAKRTVKAKKIKSEKEIEKLVDEIANDLKEIYNDFQAIQRAINKIIDSESKKVLEKSRMQKNKNKNSKTVSEEMYEEGSGYFD